MKNVRMRSYISELGKDSLVYGLGPVLTKIVGLLMIPIYAQFLSRQDFGNLTLLTFYSSLFLPLGQLGLPGAVFRFLGFDGRQRSNALVFSSGFSLTLIIASTLSVAALFNLGILSKILGVEYLDRQLLMLIIISAFFQVLNALLFAKLKIDRRMKLVLGYNVSIVLFSALMNLYYLMVLGLGLRGLVYTIVLSNMLGFILLLYVLRPSVINPFTNGIVDLSYSLIKYGVLNVPNHILAVLTLIFGQRILEAKFNESELGLYAMGLKFVLPMTILVQMIQNAWKAYKFEIKKNSATPQKDLGRVSIQIMLVLTYGYIVVSLVSPKVLLLVTNPEWHSLELYIPYILLIPYFQGLYNVTSSFISFAEAPYYAFLVGITGAIVNISLSLCLIPLFGIIGLIITMSTTWISMSIVAFLYGQRIYKVNFKIPVIISLGIVVCFCAYNDLILRICSMLMLTLFLFFFRRRLLI